MSSYYKSKYESNRKKVFRQCHKVLLVSKEDHKKTCGVLFSNGKMAVGDDCWRLSNRLDICEYPFKIYKNSVEVEKIYAIEYPSHTVFYDEGGDESNDVSQYHAR